MLPLDERHSAPLRERFVSVSQRAHVFVSDEYTSPPVGINDEVFAVPRESARRCCFPATTTRNAHEEARTRAVAYVISGTIPRLIVSVCHGLRQYAPSLVSCAARRYSGSRIPYIARFSRISALLEWTCFSLLPLTPAERQRDRRRHFFIFSGEERAMDLNQYIRPKTRTSI